MSVYKGKPVFIMRPIGDIYDKVSDLSRYQPMVEQLPEEQRARLQGVEFRGDSIKMDAPGVGELVFKISDLKPQTHVGFVAQGCPVPLSLSLDLSSIDDASTQITPVINIEIPAMLRPFIGNKIQEAADKFGEVFTSIFR